MSRPGILISAVAVKVARDRQPTPRYIITLNEDAASLESLASVYFSLGFKRAEYKKSIHNILNF